MIDVPSRSAFLELMTAIGLLMHHWSLLEHDLGDEIIRLRSSSGDLAPSQNRMRATVSERLAEWRALQSRRRRKDMAFHRGVEELGDRIQELARLRHFVTHGFAQASPEEDEGEPYILCGGNASGVGAHDIRLSLSDLNAAIAGMDDCRRALTDFGADVPG